MHIICICSISGKRAKSSESPQSTLLGLHYLCAGAPQSRLGNASRATVTMLLCGGSDVVGTDHSDLWQGILAWKSNASDPFITWTLIAPDVGSPLSPRQ